MSDLDPFAHVNNGAQCNLFDYGRSCYFEHVFNKPIDWLSMDLVLAHTELDFKKAIDIHDRLVCETKILSIGQKSVRMIQQLREVQTNVVKTTCHCVLVGIDRTTCQSIPVREEFRSVVREYESLTDDQQE